MVNKLLGPILWLSNSQGLGKGPKFSDDADPVGLGNTLIISALNYFGHLMWRTDSFEKTLMLGKIEDGRRMGQQRMRWLDVITNSLVWINSGSWWWTGRPGMLQSMGSQRVRYDWVKELNWTELKRKDIIDY